MNSYEELSRKGLIRLAEDYDTHSDGALRSFTESQDSSGVSYPLITPAEMLFENFELKKENFVESCKEMIEDASSFVDKFLSTLANCNNINAIDTETLDSMIDEANK